ncbi:hypothetical protein EC973_004533 [Apophysomyces ossiformis]|uniref:Uncharacterized protein n=1 Tax=Apophysomyces ossiformis TaxID=679940 RepID=A0A8H7BL62_9FUNG|nr:hypothetical protein EC973_004533 [Apophysomyces ossiformis]
MWRPLNAVNQPSPKRSEENVEQTTPLAGKSARNRQQVLGKSGLTVAPVAPGLKDSKIRSLDVTRRLKTNDTDTPVLKTSTQKSFSVFTEKDHSNLNETAKSISPAKRSGSPEFSLISSKRPKSEVLHDESEIEYAPQKEEELPMIPEFDLDLDAFDFHVDANAYSATSDKQTSTAFNELFNNREVTEQKDMEGTGFTKTMSEPSLPTAAAQLTSSLSNIEYAPSVEEELPFQSDVELDLSRFSHIIDSDAYFLMRHLEEEENKSESFEFDMEPVEFEVIQTVDNDTFEIFGAATITDSTEDIDRCGPLIPFYDHYYDVNNVIDCCN